MLNKKMIKKYDLFIIYKFYIILSNRCKISVGEDSKPDKI